MESAAHTSFSETDTQYPTSGLLRRYGGERPLVLIAEDDKDLRSILCRSLVEAGFDVLAASTGHDMLKLLAAASRNEIAMPDAFVMDVRMPRCSGLSVLSALRLADWQQPVIMMTAFGDLSVHEQATSWGASVSLDKPVDTDDLIEMLDVLLIKRASSSCSEDEIHPLLPSSVRTVDAPIDVLFRSTNEQ